MWSRPPGLRRVRRGEELPQINSLVDIINWCSLETQLPYGLYDLDQIAGRVTLRLGLPGEEYEGIRKSVVHVAERLTLAGLEVVAIEYIGVPRPAGAGEGIVWDREVEDPDNTFPNHAGPDSPNRDLAAPTTAESRTSPDPSGIGRLRDVDDLKVVSRQIRVGRRQRNVGVNDRASTEPHAFDDGVAHFRDAVADWVFAGGKRADACGSLRRAFFVGRLAQTRAGHSQRAGRKGSGCWMWRPAAGREPGCWPGRPQICGL